MAGHASVCGAFGKSLSCCEIQARGSEIGDFAVEGWWPLQEYGAGAEADLTQQKSWTSTKPVWAWRKPRAKAVAWQPKVPEAGETPGLFNTIYFSE